MHFLPSTKWAPPHSIREFGKHLFPACQVPGPVALSFPKYPVESGEAKQINM